MIIAITPNIILKKNIFNYLVDEQLIKYFSKYSNQIIILNRTNYKEVLREKNLLIMTGGNDLPNYNNNKANLKRYFDENIYFKYALKQKIKIIGICRGFQHIMDTYNIELKKSKGHVNKNHLIYNSQNIKNCIKVNSFHNYKIYDLPKDFKKIFICKDGSIEVAESKSKSILCTMFHPERDNINQKNVNKLIKKFIT